MKEEKLLKKQEEKESGLNIVDLTGDLPNLGEAQELKIDLVSNYWTPENIGESKKVFFIEINERMVADQSSGELLPLECASFVEQKENGELIQIQNGSKRLVGALESAGIQKGTPLLITYLGKKRNKSNQFSSDNWSIKPLIINV